jgi:hypothetical protein
VNSFVPDLVITSITPPLKPEYSTEAGATLTESCSIALREIGLLCAGYPLSFRPKSSLNEVPSTLKSLVLGCAPAIELPHSYPQHHQEKP